jgi:hypothetical protein
MLEYLTARKQAGEDVEIVYNGSVFAGYGYVTRRAEASALESSYASGETVALYEAIPVAVSGAGDASGCQKAVAERDFSGRVTRMYLRDGDSGEETDILYYDLTGLDLWTSDWLDGIRRDYLYDRDHQRISADEAEKIRSSMETAGAEYSVYGFLGEVPYLEITGGDLTSLQYAAGTGRITAEDSMQIYHLDANGNRDARIDPANGMAYVMNENDAESERTAESVLVWPVYIHRDENGKITETKKLQSYRLNASEPEEEDIVLSGVAAGTYIMEEMIEPDGYRKGMPTGITVQETTKLQKVSMTNTVTKIELALLDGDDSAEEEKLAGYSYAPVPGAVLALYDACRIYTSNTKKYPKGYYLSKTSADPVSYRAVDDSSGQQFTEALWTTGVTPLYLEGIPAGDYILEELQFPEGYEKSTPMEIEIRNQNTVQQYWMYSEHTEPKMLISKTLQSARGELTGVSMALYRATEDGKLQMLPEYLEDAWITGEDGVYTEEDQQKDHIADGYVPGDRKPHEVSDLESGIYWLAELQSQAYLKEPEPMQIVYTRKKSRQLFRSESAMVEASLKIAKTDPDAKPLTGAVYQLSAFRPADSEHPVFEKEVSGAEAAIEIKGLPVGEIAYRSTSAGIAQEPYVIPYTYQLKEILPPQSYCVNPAFYRWRFPENQDGASYRREDMACKEITIMNDITRIPIGRKEWVRADEEACYVPGTQAAVYEITGRDAAGNPEYSKEHPYWIWTLQEDREEILKGLTAGHSYVLLEEAVPDGHPLMQPVIFTISEDGTMISELYAIGNGGELSWKTEAEDAEHIRLSSVAGRYVLSTEMVLLDEAGQELTRWYVHAQEHLFIRPKSYVDGDCVTVQEIVHYSDGTGQTIRQEKRSLIFDENGICRIPCRKASDMILRLLDASGQEIVSFSPGPGRWEFLTEEADEMLYFLSEGYYVLAEMTVFSDGEETMTGNVRIFPDKRMEPEKTEEKTTVELLKTENTGGMLLPGCELELQTADGESVAQWISGNEPKIMENILVAGEKYVLIEKKPAPGYAYAEPVPFTVSKGTSTDRIFMEDKPTVVEIGTALGSPGSYLSGVLMQILDETGNICESWVSSGETYLVTARLHAGENYILREMKSPARYKKGEDIRFTVPNDGTKLTLWMINQRKNTNSSEHGRTEEEPKVKIKTTGWITASYYPVLTWIGTGEWRDGIRIMSRTGQNPGNGQIRTETGKTGESTRNGMNLQLHSGESTQSGENPDSWEARMSRTGDSGRTALYLVLAVLSLLGMTIIFWQKKMTKDRRFDIMDSVRKNKRKKRDLSGDPSEEADNR